MRDHPPAARFARLKYALALGGLLICATLICLVLERVQGRFGGERSYAFLAFNLALAWIPLIAAGLAYLSMRRRVTFLLIMPLATLVWLIFFPNAAYLLTDFQHLAYDSGRTPLWFDVVLLIWFAWTGVLLGITSLALMQSVVRRVFNPAVGWIFAVGATALSSVGVYLGRFLRWNSWDLLYDPLPIAKDMAAIMRHPVANLPSYVFTILFTLVLLFIYLAIYFFHGALREED